MIHWTIGDVTIKRVVEFETPVPYYEKRPLIAEARPERLSEMPWLYPHFVTAEGHLMTSVHALLVEAPGLKLVVDTCVGNDKPRRMTGRQPLATKFLQALRDDAGWSVDDVQAVVCTHLHVDHVGWNTRREGERWVPTFPRARYLLGRQEYEYWLQDDDPEQRAVLGDSIQPLFDASLVQLVEMNHRLSPEVRLIPTPGHTPGHVSVLIESGRQTALITGDVMHHPCQVGRPDWATSFDQSRQDATITRRSMLDRYADEPVLVIGTHFASPCSGYIKREGNGYRFEAAIQR